MGQIIDPTEAEVAPANGQEQAKDSGADVLTIRVVYNPANQSVTAIPGPGFKNPAFVQHVLESAAEVFQEQAAFQQQMRMQQQIAEQMQAQAIAANLAAGPQMQPRRIKH